MIVHQIQQGSPEWLQLRLGKVTGTSLGRVFKADYLSLIDELVSEQLTDMPADDSFVSDAMQRGIDLQDDALDLYEAMTGVTLIRGGFVQSDRFPLLGYSPDGRVGIAGGVEVKCPSSKRHVQYLRQAKLPAEYRWQVLGSFLINPDCEWYDFMSYDPRVQQRPWFLHRTNRIDVVSELTEAEATLAKFFTKLDQVKSDILFPLSSVGTQRIATS